MNQQQILSEALAILGRATPHFWSQGRDTRGAEEWGRRAAAFVREHRNFKLDSIPTWTTERPTAGKWWVAIAPARRGMFPDYHAVIGCEVGELIALDLGTHRRHILTTSSYLTGALWLKREAPADPFAVDSASKNGIR